VYVAEWERWRRAREERLASPHGFLAITGLHWLSGEPERFSDAPGAWYSMGSDVFVELEPGEELTIEERVVTERYRFDDVDELGTWANFGVGVIEVARRDGHFMIRPRNPHHDVRTRYTGTPTYEASTEWLVPGQFTPYREPRDVIVGASVEGLTHVYASPGEIVFESIGREFRLIAFNGDGPDELFIVFSDETAGDTTYAACRFLDVDAPDADGRVTLDFNRARNPPCAYTDLATCPLPPQENKLSLRVDAGEKRPLPQQ
jgi:uncharacterized protein